MSSRTEEKQKRRTERVDAERLEAARGSRRRAIRILSAAVTVAIVVAAVAIAIATTGGARRGSGEAAGAFAQHYAGLTSRRKQAGVTTMMDTMGSKAHFHPKLRIFANGKRVEVPPNIGVDPTQDGMAMASLHTHDADGTIHVEGMGGASLGQFFAVWGVSLSANRLGPHRGPVRMWVNDKPSEALGALKLAKDQRIVLSVGKGNPTP